MTGTHNNTDQIVWFWEILLDHFNDEDKREFLTFVSGSPRAPPKGLG